MSARNVKGLWTKVEIMQAHRLLEACEANGAHWEFADWLLAKEPMGVIGPGRNNGSHARLDALAAEICVTRQHLHRIRKTAYVWPPQYRVPNASFDAHYRLSSGGPATAPARSAELASRPRNRDGRVRSTGYGSRSSVTLNVAHDIYGAVVAEAAATNQGIGATAAALITEALEARAWLASEVAA